MNIQLALRNMGHSIDRNSQTILTALAVAGVVSTVAMAIRATPVALDLIEKEKDFREDEFGIDHDTSIEPKDVVELTWKAYIPTAMMGATTITCIILANHISLRRNAALASLLTLAEQAAREYQTKVVEQIGEKKEEKIRDEIAQDRLKKHPIESATVIVTGKGEHLFFDSFSGRYFKSDVETIRRLVNDFNQRLIKCAPMFLPINDFYYELGLESIDMGDEMGWNAEDNMMEVATSSAKVHKGEPVIILDYKVWPKHY
jgi:Family of unknown function (DUF6353)